MYTSTVRVQYRYKYRTTSTVVQVLELSTNIRTGYRISTVQTTVYTSTGTYRYDSTRTRTVQVLYHNVSLQVDTRLQVYVVDQSSRLLVRRTSRVYCTE